MDRASVMLAINERIWESSSTKGSVVSQQENSVSSKAFTGDNEALKSFGRSSIGSPVTERGTFDDSFLAEAFISSKGFGKPVSRIGVSNSTIFSKEVRSRVAPSPPPPTPIEGPLFSHLSTSTSSSFALPASIEFVDLHDQFPLIAPAAGPLEPSDNNNRRFNSINTGTSSGPRNSSLRISTSFDRTVLPNVRFLEARRARRGLPPTPTEASASLDHLSEVDWSMADDDMCAPLSAPPIGLTRRSSFMSPSPLSARPFSGIDIDGVGMRRSSSGPIGGVVSNNIGTSPLNSSNVECSTTSTSPTTSSTSESPLSPPPLAVGSSLPKKPSSLNTQLAPPQVSTVAASAPTTPAVPQFQFSPVGSNTGAGSLWVLSFVNSSISAPTTPMESNGQVPPTPITASNSTASGPSSAPTTMITPPTSLAQSDSAYGSTSSLISSKTADDMADNKLVDEAFTHALSSMSLGSRHEALSLMEEHLSNSGRQIHSRSLAASAGELDVYEKFSTSHGSQNVTPIEAMYQQLLASQNPMATYNNMNAPRFPTPLCRHFIAGRCWAGSHCRFTHLMGPPPSSSTQTSRPICKHFIVGRCWAGNLCRFAHFPVASQAQQDISMPPNSLLHHHTSSSTTSF